MRRFKRVMFLVLALLALIIVMQNTEPVQTELLFTSVTMPRAILLGLTLLVGFVCGILATTLRHRSHGTEA